MSEDKQQPRQGSTGPPVTGEFNADMLRLARGAQGETQTQLAKALSVYQGKVSKWEDGLSLPSEEEIERIARHLQYPVVFFFQQDAVYGFGTCCLYHRKRKKLAVKTLNVIHDRINVMRIGIARLLRNVDELPVQFERMDVDEYDSPEQIAQLTRAAWQMPYGPVRSLVAVVEAAGGIVVQCPFGTSQLDAVSQWPRGMPPLFFVNTDNPVDRWRFTLAHEVGHIIMHRVPTANAEEEADRFASEFLMPKRDVALDLHSLTVQKALRLKPRWRVSMQALIRRARDVGTITDRKYTSLFTYLSKLGYRKNEPGPLAPEHPTTLQRLIDVHFEHLGYSFSELSKLVFCTEQRFRADYLNEADGGPFRVVS